MKPKGLENCKNEVDFFMKMMGEDNITLLTVQSNIVGNQQGIEKNRPFVPISEKEMR